ncbi:MAG: preprotein translocase subunit Sec61beta [Candidatus Nanohaloarchaeota archaeon]|nr:preprotein translocase subunit Sec61beta [Candidatus Nanohaloarchaeota archaeon]
MSKKLKKYLPQTTAGLVRFYEEDVSKIQIHPAYVIGFSVALIFLLVLVHYFLYAPVS